MAQNYKPKLQTKSKQNTKPIPGWLWLVSGVTIGLFVAFLTYLVLAKPNATNPSKEAVTPANKAEQNTVRPTVKKEPPAEPAEPRFSFYTELPKIKIEIPVEELENLTTDASDKSDKTPVRSTSQESIQREANTTPKNATSLSNPPELSSAKRGNAYVLQVGSFKSYNEADQLKAKLAFMGVEANIQPVSVGNKDRWYRVRVGPYYNQNQANTVKQKLKQQRIPAIVLKLSE